MKFQKIEKIPLRNEVITYLLPYYKCNINYNLYFGIFNLSQSYLSILIIENDDIFNIGSEIDIKNISKTLNKSSDDLNHIYLDNNAYIRYPISLDFIDWIKAELKIITETVDDYNKLSLPYINSILEKNTKWINDLLFKFSEESKILYRCNEFVICKDIIWTSNHPNEFYILAIPTMPLKTIRDLSQEHIPLLKNIKSKVIEIANEYNLNANNLYMFFHYHPSYYHMHLHICIIDHHVLETKYHRNYLLDTVIQLLELNYDYWKNATLKFELLSTSKLYRILEHNK